MTIREDELIEEINALQVKLEHAQKWMNRQVLEDARTGKWLFARINPKPSISDHVFNFMSQLKKIRFFHRRPTLTELWLKRLEAFFVGAAIILFWRGIWNLADEYLFPWQQDLSALASLLIGLGIMILSKNFVNQFLDEAVEEADDYE